MLLPTIQIKVRAVTGRDVYGQAVLSPAKLEKCAPVRLDFGSQNTTVRTDSSSTHGHANERTAKVVILVRPDSHARVDSQVELLSNKVRVIERHPRFRVTGVLDHYELGCESWG